VLILVLAYTASWWFLLALALPLAIERTARPKLRRRNELMIDAVIRGEVRAPVIDRLRQHAAARA
jgi:hypothetical protein